MDQIFKNIQHPIVLMKYLTKAAKGLQNIISTNGPNGICWELESFENQAYAEEPGKLCLGMGDAAF